MRKAGFRIYHDQHIADQATEYIRTKEYIFGFSTQNTGPAVTRERLATIDSTMH